MAAEHVAARIVEWLSDDNVKVLYALLIAVLVELGLLHKDMALDRARWRLYGGQGGLPERRILDIITGMRFVIVALVLSFVELVSPESRVESLREFVMLLPLFALLLIISFNIRPASFPPWQAWWANWSGNFGLILVLYNRIHLMLQGRTPTHG